MKNSSNEELLTNDGSVSIHQRNIQALATELYKIKSRLSPEIISEIFASETESHYNLRRCNDLRIPSIRTVYHSSESISFLRPKIWNILPDEIKQQTSLNSFKKSVKKWKPQDCPCRLCKVYNIGLFMDFREILLWVTFLLFFNSKDIALFTYSTLITKITLLCNLEQVNACWVL